MRRKPCPHDETRLIPKPRPRPRPRVLINYEEGRAEKKLFSELFEIVVSLKNIKGAPLKNILIKLFSTFHISSHLAHMHMCTICIIVSSEVHGTS
jgi:hypothetical protein